MDLPDHDLPATPAEAGAQRVRDRRRLRRAFWWSAGFVVLLMVVWLVLFVVACAWWTPHPRRLPGVAVFTVALWFALVSAGGAWLGWTA